jgi:nudix-type nucleoside diphosphatase (YffH/AdpP family)
MSLVFLPGPLAAPDIVAGLAGRAAVAEPAWLDGHRLAFDPATLRLVVVAAGGSRLDGGLLGSGPEGGRAAFLLAAMGGVPVDALAGTPEGPRPARVFRGEAATAPAGGFPDDDAEARAVLAEAVPEILAQSGRMTPEEVAAVLGPIAFRARARVRGAMSQMSVALRSGLSRADVAPVSRDFGYARFLAVEEHVLRHRRFDGGMSRPLGRAVLTSGDAVTVLPFDPRRGTVLLVEQFRAGPFARRDPHPWTLEAVAGRCDGMEPPEATARREALEEAGLVLGRLARVAGYYPTPGIAAEFITSFVGEADLGAAGGVHGLEGEDEDIRVLTVPLDRALEAIASGEIGNAPLLVSLLWLERNRERLAAQWG